MVKVPPIPFLRRRERRTAPAAPPAALVVVGVQDLHFDPGYLEFTLVFNTSEEFPLRDTSVPPFLNPAKWWARYGGQRCDVDDIYRAAYNQLYVGMIPSGPEAGANEVGYTNAPSDIWDELGRYLAAFTFPL